MLSPPAGQKYIRCTENKQISQYYALRFNLTFYLCFKLRLAELSEGISSVKKKKILQWKKQIPVVFLKGTVSQDLYNLNCCRQI